MCISPPITKHWPHMIKLNHTICIKIYPYLCAFMCNEMWHYATYRSSHTFLQINVHLVLTNVIYPWWNTITRSILRLCKKSWTQIFLVVHSIIGNIMHDERYLVDWSSTHLQTIQVFDYQRVLGWCACLPKSEFPVCPPSMPRYTKFDGFRVRFKV
jgi:hypothetical protein